MDGFFLAASIYVEGIRHMEKLELERRDWVAYALAAGFVLVSSGAVAPKFSASIAGVLRRIATAFI